MIILGYINRNMYFPSPLTIIATKNSKYYAIFPSNHTVEIEDYENEIEALPNFYKENKHIILNESDIAYGISETSIIIDNPNNIYEYIKKLSTTLEVYLKENIKDADTAY